MNKVEEIVEGFLGFLSSRGQLNLLPQIIKQLNQHLKEQEDFAYVTSAIDLTDEEKEKISRFLKRTFGRDYLIDLQIDPEIIGGLKIVVGDEVIDYSVVGRLNSLREKLS